MPTASNAQNNSFPCWKGSPIVEATAGTVVLGGAFVSAACYATGLLSLAVPGVAVIVSVAALALLGISLIFHAAHRDAQWNNRKVESLQEKNKPSADSTQSEPATDPKQKTVLPKDTGQSPPVENGNNNVSQGTGTTVTPPQEQALSTNSADATKQQEELPTGGDASQLPSTKPAVVKERGTAATPCSRFGGIGDPLGSGWPINLPKPPKKREEPLVANAAADASQGLPSTITKQQTTGGDRAENNEAPTLNPGQSPSVNDGGQGLQGNNTDATEQPVPVVVPAEKSVNQSPSLINAREECKEEVPSKQPVQKDKSSGIKKRIAQLFSKMPCASKTSGE